MSCFVHAFFVLGHSLHLWRSIRHITCFRTRMYVVGVALILRSILGVKCPSFLFLLVVLSQTRELFKLSYEKTAAIPTKFCTVIKTPVYSSWFVPKCAPQIQDGGMPTFWEYDKSLYLIYWFWWSIRHMTFMGIALTLHSISGIKCPQKSHLGDVNKCCQAKWAKYSNFPKSELPQWFQQILCNDKDLGVGYSSRGVSKCAIQIQDGGRPLSWKNDKSRSISSNRLTDFDHLFVKRDWPLTIISCDS